MKNDILYKMLFIKETLKYEVLSEDEKVIYYFIKKYKKGPTQKKNTDIENSFNCVSI